MTQQEIIEDWRAWLIANGVSKDVADKLLRMGPSALEYLLQALYEKPKS